MLTDFFFFNELINLVHPDFQKTVQSQLIGVEIFEKGLAVFVCNMQMMLKLVEGDLQSVLGKIYTKTLVLLSLQYCVLR